MNKLLLLAGVAMLAACGDQQATAPAAEDANVAAAGAEDAALTSLHETTWTFTMDGKEIQESIDSEGNYIANAGDEHVDHGTYAMVDGRHCFTSAMTDEGQVCWTVPDAQVGESVEVTNDAGETLTVTRQEYVPMTMPS
jgi:hypothetical protein